MQLMFAWPTAYLPTYNKIIQNDWIVIIILRLFKLPRVVLRSCWSAPALQLRTEEGILLWKIGKRNQVYKYLMYQGQFQSFSAENAQSKLEDSLPTNVSSLRSQPQHSRTVTKGNCTEQQELESQRCAERAMEWLKSIGVVAGDPEELVTQHRSEQKKNIILKIGRAEGRARKGLPSLITRRLKSKNSSQFNS